jgi:hypothetical protein
MAQVCCRLCCNFTSNVIHRIEALLAHLRCSYQAAFANSACYNCDSCAKSLINVERKKAERTGNDTKYRLYCGQCYIVCARECASRPRSLCFFGKTASQCACRLAALLLIQLWSLHILRAEKVRPRLLTV